MRAALPREPFEFSQEALTGVEPYDVAGHPAHLQQEARALRRQLLDVRESLKAEVRGVSDLPLPLPQPLPLNPTLRLP